MTVNECDIIMPVYNKKEMTKNCLESIARPTRSAYFLTIIDNGSDADTKKFLEEYKAANKNTRVITNRENLGWIRAVNQGMRLSQSPYLLLMNNDTIVRTDDWLSKMISIAESEPDIGLVNPTFDVKKKAFSSAPYIEVDFCRGYCVLIKRTVMDKIGLLDEAYGLGYYDDDDYSVRATRAGFRCVRANDVVVEHLRDSTFKTVFEDDKRRALHERNKELFYSKWGRRKRFVFVVTKDADRDRALGDLFSLARKQHIVYVWNLGKPLCPQHINIRETLLPAFFPRFLFSAVLALNKFKKPSKRYDAVFVDRVT